MTKNIYSENKKKHTFQTLSSKIMQKITHFLMHCSRKMLEEKKEKKKGEWSLYMTDWKKIT